MSTETSTLSAPAFSLVLRDDRPILYKFYLKDRSLVPRGLRELQRDNERKIDERHIQNAIAAGKPHLAQEGRVGAGRFDTGRPIHQMAEFVRIRSIRSLLALKGYRLGDAHFFKQVKGGKTQWVVVLRLQVGVEPIQLSPETVEDLRRLARESTYTANIYDNEIENTQTLNFTMRQPGQKAKLEIVVRGGCIKLIDSDGTDVAEAERTEDLASAEAIRELVASFKK